MPMLPTIEVTQPQADRLIAAFGSVAAYRAWLRRSVVGYVAMVDSGRNHEAIIKELDPIANPVAPTAG